MPHRPDVTLDLGDYLLSARIGAGGCGVVYAGVHRPSGHPVAVKLVTTERARTDRAQATFAREARAVAGLDHPGIVAIFDYGRVPEGLPFAAGSPFLVMERADSDLHTDPDAWDWARTADALGQILDALAHAHAHGVLHRDVKPTNLLVFGAESAVRLADFGIAAAIDAEDGSGERSGSPEYMAPEQIRGDWRAQGPWTDLYALGCTAWRLATGANPFRGDDVLRAQLDVEPPPFRPRMAVPSGLEPWLRQLLAKDPRERFQRAADARAALGAIGTPDVGPTPGSERGAAGRGTTWTVGSLPAGTTDVSGHGLASPPPALVTRAAASAPPAAWPTSWQQVPSRRRAPPGVGLGLFGLRRLPLAGREGERDALWAALGRVRQRARPEVVVLRGAAGTGKSRLAAWLGERADELGAATVLRATCGPSAGAADELQAMLRRAFRVGGLDRPAVWDRVRSSLLPHSADLAPALTAWMSPTGDPADGVPPHRFSSAGERRATARAWLAGLARARPVLLCVDDAHHGVEALELARHLLAVWPEETGPVLVVLTVREEALDEGSHAAELLGEIAASPYAATLRVDPLDESERAELVREGLGLDEEVARQVEARSAGVPLFAVQLVSDWVERGFLQPGLQGFSLRPGGSLEIPATIHALWQVRIDALLSGLTPEDRVALEVAGTLGPVVNAAEWAEVCERLGVRGSPELLERALRTRLAVASGPEEWSFVHGMLGESLRRLAREADRAEALHRACADVLAKRGGDAALRRIDHLEAAGDREAAMPPMQHAIELLRSRGDPRGALDMLARFESAADALGIPRGDFNRVDARLRACESYTVLRRFDEARRALDEGLAVYGGTGSGKETSTLHYLAYLHMMEGRPRDMLAPLYRALEVAPAKHVVFGTIHHLLAWALGGLGRIDEGERHFAEAAQVWRAAATPDSVTWCGNTRSLLALGRGDYDAAARVLEEQRTLGREMGHQPAIMFAEHGLGNVARARGDYTAALEHDGAYARWFEENGTPDPYPELFLACSEAGLGRAREALERAERAFAAWSGPTPASARVLLHVLRAECHASLGDAGAFDAAWADALGAGARDIDEIEVVGFARALERVASAAAAQGWAGRARPPLELAVGQWRRLGRDREAGAVAERLAALPVS